MIFLSPKKVIALRDSNESSLSNSSSGGAFAVLARMVLSDGGVVFGASLQDDLYVRHISVSSIEDLEHLQGSKYVKSDIGNAKQECFDYLKQGRFVLFSGTPCQISSLKSYLDKQDVASIQERLICVDLICHGTPDPNLFDLYLKWLAKKVNADDGIHGLRFRSKLIEWGLYYYYYYYRNGKKRIKFGPATEDPYYKAFLEGGIYRECCYKCPFARKERVGDFTIGDYWGIQEEHPDFFDKSGCSAVLINTDKALSYFEAKCASQCWWVESSFDKVARHNRNLLEPTALPEQYEEIRLTIKECIKHSDAEGIFDGPLKIKYSLKQLIRMRIPVNLYLKLRRIKHR